MLGVFWKIQKLCSKMSTRILKIDLEMTEIMDPKVGNPFTKKQNLPSKWYFQNLVYLTYCAITWPFFHVGSKVRRVLKSSSPELLKNGQKFFCMWSPEKITKSKCRQFHWTPSSVALYLVELETILREVWNTIVLTTNPPHPLCYGLLLSIMVSVILKLIVNLREGLFPALL